MDDKICKKFFNRTIGASTGFASRDEQLVTDAGARDPSDPVTELAADADYDLQEELGRGGMGLVYRARQPRLERSVAVKTIRPDLAGAEAVASFICEARVTGHLAHPNIVPVIDLGSSSTGETYLAMKLVEGRSWAAQLSGLEADSPAESVFLDFDDDEEMEPADFEPRLRLGDDLEPHLEIFLSICQAMAFVHSRGFIHRDIKPTNIMIGAFGEVLVMDWGLAVDIAEEQAGDRPSITHRKNVTESWGTPAYMAPEMARGEGSRLGPWTDVFLLGATLHEVVTGLPPHAGTTLQAVLDRAADPAPLEFDEAVPTELQNILRRAMAPRIEDRYPDVPALRDALRAFRKHHESLRLVDAAARAADEARQVIAARSEDSDRSHAYALFTAAIATFDQALLLWPDNEVATESSRRARMHFARAAFELGDLALARSQLVELEDAEARDLLRRVGEQEEICRNTKRTATRLRRGVAAASLLLVIAIVVLASRWDDIRRGRIEAERLRVEALLQDGFYELGEGSGEEAARIFEEILSTTEEAPPEAVAGIVLTHIRSGDLGRARERLDLHHADDLDPGFGWLRVELLLNEGDEEAAEAMAARLEQPGDALSCFIVGVRLSLVGHRLEAQGLKGDEEAAAGAREAYRDSLDLLTRAMLHSESLRALYVFNRAHAAGHAQDEQAVHDCAALMTRRYSESPHAWFWSGFAFERLGGHPDQALRGYQEALARDPENARYLFCLGTTQLARDDELALEYLARADAANPDDPETLCNLGHVSRNLGRFAEAVAYFEAGHMRGRERGDDWHYPSEVWLREARTLRQLDEEVLPAVLAGERRLVEDDAHELTALESIARRDKSSADLAAAYRRQLAEADLRTHPTIFFRAGCNSLTASISAADAEEARRLREEARQWITQSLGRCHAAVRAGLLPAADVRRLISGALDDHSLDPVRAGVGLEALEPDEIEAWTRLWDEAARGLSSLRD